MTPSNAENDPVHKGLHELSQQMEQESPAPPSDPADDPVERGLHELGRQIEESERTTRGRRRKGAHAAAKKRSGKRTVAWVLGAVGMVIVLLIGATAGYAWYLNHEIHRIDLHNLTSAPVKGERRGDGEHPDDRLHLALRAHGAEPGLRAVLAGCQRRQQRRRDDPAPRTRRTHSVSILSIPRDLFVPNARSDGANKIDAALYQGPDQLIDAIEEDFGIPIQHFVELNFDSFINVVNALGGIKMYFPEPVYDAYSGLNIQTTGCLQLNGTQALQVVRARHLQYKGPGVTTDDPTYWPQEAQSDIARIRRDHEFLRVLATAVKAKGLGNPITDQQIVVRRGRASSRSTRASPPPTCSTSSSTSTT